MIIQSYTGSEAKMLWQIPYQEEVMLRRGSFSNAWEVFHDPKYGNWYCNIVLMTLSCSRYAWIFKGIVTHIPNILGMVIY